MPEKYNASFTYFYEAIFVHMLFSFSYVGLQVSAFTNNRRSENHDIHT